MTRSQPRHRGGAKTVANEVWVFASRLLVQWCRHPTVPLQALVFPAVLLLTYSVLVGKSMTRITGNSGLDLLIPVCALVGAMSGSAASGSMMSHDRESGLLTRLWMMPVRRGSALAGIVLAEALRTLSGTALVAAIGYPALLFAVYLFLSARIARRAWGDEAAPIAIVLHPHPAYGGTMNNRVVYNLHYAFHRMGFTVLRFNFMAAPPGSG